MAIRRIVKVGDKLLREKSREVTVFDDRLATLIDDMFETMFKENGVGLAAPQVGLLKRVCVVCTDGNRLYELVNPVVISSQGSQTFNEGCLSVPGRNGTVCRPASVIVEAFDRFGKKHIYKVSGFEAVAFCHEIDHLNGILFIDKVIDSQ